MIIICMSSRSRKLKLDSRMVSVAEKTVIYCACALYRRRGTHSKTQTVIHTAEYFLPSTVFMHVKLVWKLLLLMLAFFIILQPHLLVIMIAPWP
jgi:uncharacterized PurR-regulated membrane protein YhhQ (DUF165 family)